MKPPIQFELRRNELTVAMGQVFQRNGIIHPCTITPVLQDGSPLAPFEAQIGYINFTEPNKKKRGRKKGSFEREKHCARLLAQEYFKSEGMTPTCAAEKAAEVFGCDRSTIFRSLATIGRQYSDGWFIAIPGSESEPTLRCQLLATKITEATRDHIAGRAFLWRPGMAYAEKTNFRLSVEVPSGLCRSLLDSRN